MEKHVEVSMLWQIYGKLLTEKQYNVLNEYYNEDLSLAEIAENYNISRQAVRDIIMKGESKLFDYEKKLNIMKTSQDNDALLQLVFSQIAQIKKNTPDKQVEKILDEVQKELQCIA